MSRHAKPAQASKPITNCIELSFSQQTAFPFHPAAELVFLFKKDDFMTLPGGKLRYPLN
jgi:hypothetical protein